MRIKLKTLVDITETNARRQDDKKLYSQQANYNTVLQTIGLRVNLSPVYCKVCVGEIDTLGFGKSYTGKQRYWDFCFEVDYEGAINQEMLKNDFDLIPIITDLDETASNNNRVFRTSCKNDTNIVFNFLED